MPERREVLEKIKEKVAASRGELPGTVYKQNRDGLFCCMELRTGKWRRRISEQVPETDLGGVVAKANLKRRAIKEVCSSLSQQRRLDEAMTIDWSCFEDAAKWRS